VKIFVSYSRIDGSNYANHIYEYLKEFGHDVFTDIENIHAGNVWTKVIEENIPNCDIFVIIVTPASLRSMEVAKEVELAKEKNKQIIPCVIKKILTIEEIGWDLNTIQGIEFVDKQELGLELYNVIRKMEILRKKPSIKKTIEDEIKQDSVYVSENRYFKSAEKFEKLDNLDKAVEMYDIFLQKDPENFDALFRKSLVLAKSTKYGPALDTLEKAINFNPDHSDVWYHRGCFLEELEKYDDAIKSFDYDLKIDKKDVKSSIAKARVLEKIGRNEECLNVLDEILNLYPKDVKILEKKGAILDKLSRYDEEIDCYDKILELQPDNQSIFISKGHVLQRLQRYEEAIECYDKVLNSKSGNIEVRIERCVAILKSNRYQEAVECYDETIQLYPDNKLLWLSKGNILNKNLKQYKEAIDCYDNVLQLDPQDQDTKKNRESALYDLEKERFANLIDEANSYYEKKNYIKVIEICDKAIETGKENYIPYLYKAKSLQQLSRYEDAISCYDKVLSIDKNNQEAISNKEIAKANIKKQRYLSIIEEIKVSYTNKDYSQVIILSDKSTKLEPDNPISYLYKGHAFNELKKYEEAIQCYDKILEIDPNNEDAFNKRTTVQEQLDKQLFEQKKSIDNWLNQGNNFFNQGKCNEAIECYYKALEIDPNNKVVQEGLKLANERLFKEKSECYISWSDIKHKKIYSVDGKMMGKIEKISQKYIMIEEGRIKKKKFWLPKFLANVYIGGNVINMNYLCLHIKKDEIKQRYYYDEEPTESQYDLDRSEFNTKYGKNKSNFSSEYIKCNVIKM
jgi:tetratricopeptide (TPR) repeat protein